MKSQTAKSVYREIEIQGATPLQVVVALYDAALQDIRGAIAAQKHNDIEERTAQVKHCLLTLEQLQGRLDFERGGEIAEISTGFIRRFAESWWRPRSKARPTLSAQSPTWSRRFEAPGTKPQRNSLSSSAARARRTEFPMRLRPRRPRTRPQPTAAGRPRR